MIVRFCHVLTFLFLFSNAAIANQASSLRTVGVFCSADDKIPNTFKVETFQLGKYIARSKFNLVTGGSKTGLMKEVVDGYHAENLNGNIYGVIPQALKKFDI